MNQVEERTVQQSWGPDPVLVVGPSERAASLVAWALGQHARLRLLDGTWWLTTYAGAMVEVHREATEVRQTKSALARVGQLHGKLDEVEFWRAAAGLVDRYVRTADGEHDERWVTAPPEAWQNVEGLADLFPAARVVHVSVEPGLAVAGSATRSRANPRPVEVDQACRTWVDATRACLAVEQRRGAGRVFRLDLEDLLAHPTKIIGDCLDFLGLPDDPGCEAMLQGIDASSLAPVDVSTLPGGREALALFAELGQRPVPEAPNLEWPPASPQEGREAAVEPSPGPETQLCRFVDGALPAGSVVAVISRGDPRLLGTAAATARHFPSSPDGTYLGYHPPDSAAAIAMLDEAIAQGVDHLVLPRPSFWWLDFYAGFRRHLQRSAELVAYHGQVAAVFSLRGRPSGHRRLFSPEYCPEEAESPPEPAEHRRLAASAQADEETGQALAGAVDQFLLLGPDEGLAPPSGWAVRERQGWRVATHPHLPVLDLVDAESRAPAGWVLGWPIDEGGLIRDRVTLQGSGEGGAAFEKELDRLSGRFVLVRTARRPRLYLDGAGSLAAVYHRDRRLVASTPTVLLTVLEGGGFPRPPLGAFPSDVPNRFLPAGLTAHEAVSRLLPNHALDLQRWVAGRHWPREPLKRVDEHGLVACLSDIAADVRRTLDAHAREGELLIGLTAGRDSRLLLACARDLLDRVGTFTFDYGPNGESVIDVAVARQLAAQAGVPHTTVPVPEAVSDADAAAYLWSIGHGAHPGKARDFRVAARRHLPLSRTLVPGFFGGGIGRGFYWPKMPKARGQLTPRKLLERLRLPTDMSALMQAMAGWLEAVPDGDARFVLDLLYHEHRGGCWASQHLYGFAPFNAIVLPFGSRRVMRAMLRLPVVYRAKKRMPEDLIRMTAPELLDLPFQELPR